MVYPRQYRETKGEEILATLLDGELRDGRLSHRETAAILRHATGLRVRHLHPATLLVLLALVGASFGAGVAAVAGPHSYRATETVSPLPHSVISESVLQSQAQRFREVLASPQEMMSRYHVGTLEPAATCSVGVVARSVSLTCDSSIRRIARLDVEFLVESLGADIFHWQRFEDRLRASVLPLLISTKRSDVERLAAELRDLPRSSSQFSRLARQLASATHTVNQLALVDRMITSRLPSDPKLTTVGGPAQPVYRVSAGGVAIGAGIGLLLGAVVVIARQRRKRGPPVVA